MSLQDAAAIMDGTCPEGADWADGYPAEATLVAAALVVVATREGRDLGPWGVFQVVREGRVVGGLGYIHGPDADGAVQIGFSETDAAREHDDLVAGVMELIAHARSHGAALVRAEVGMPRAVEVLAAAGMREVHVADGVHIFEA